MRQLYALIYLLVLAPTWAASDQRIASLKPAEAVSVATLICESESENTASQSEYDGPDVIHGFTAHLPASGCSDQSTGEATRARNSHYYPVSIRAPPQNA